MIALRRAVERTLAVRDGTRPVAAGQAERGAIELDDRRKTAELLVVEDRGRDRLS